MRFILVPYFLTLLNLAIACGAPPMDSPVVTPVDNPRTETSRPPLIDPDLLEAVQIWKADCYRLSQMHCGSLLNKVDSIRVVENYKDKTGKVESYTIGQCRLSAFGPIVTHRALTVRRDILKYPNTLRAVMAHELGHCIWLLDHVEDETHLMAPYIMGETTLNSQLDSILTRFYRDITAGNIPHIGGVNDE